MKTLNLNNIPPLLRDYLTYMQTVKGRSSATVAEYKRDLFTFFHFLKVYWGLVPKDAPFSQINLNDIDIAFVKKVGLSDAYAFLVYCSDERSNNPNTRARKISSIRSFFNYLCNKVNVINVNPMTELETPKTKKALPKYLTLEQSQQLLEAVDGTYKERDYCILTLFLNCGLRLSELCSLNVTDIRSDHTLRITGKGNKERIIYLNEACVSALERYLKKRPVEGVKDKKALFISRQMNRISRQTIQYNVVYKALEKIGLSGQGYSVHKLRHTAATLMYQYGQVDIRVLKDVLGHENLGTTEIYTHLSNKQLENAAKSNPLATYKPGRKKKAT